MSITPGLVTVVMPVYNGEQYLRQAIDSMLAQTYANWELVLVDDGSHDGTAAIARQYQDPRIRYHYQENRGQAAALNTGLALAQGEFVTTLDADDWYPPESLAARVAHLQQHPACAACYGDGYYCYEAGQPFLKFTDHMPSGQQGDVYDILVVSPFYGTGATVLIRRQALREHDIWYDEAIVWCQDWDFYIRLAAVAQFGFTSANTIYYRMHEAGMTVTMPQGRRLESLIRLRHKVLAAARFAQVTPAQQSAFFYDLLIQDLSDRVTEQEAVFLAAPFGRLAASEQSRLLRLTAVKYILQGTHIPTARRWLWMAWRKAPFDRKTAVVVFLSLLNIPLTQKVVAAWQGKQNNAPATSPFALALQKQPDQ